VRVSGFNAQQPPHVSWPASPVVARAYLDQLARTKGIQPERAAAVKSALERGGSARAQLESIATQLESDAASASRPDASRLKALAATLKGIAAPR
jgi:hypothetical protein